MSDISTIATHKVTTIVSFVLAVYGNLRYLVGRSPFDKHSPFLVNDTPFSANILVTLSYWVVLYILQASFIAQIFVPLLELQNREHTLKVGWHFTLFNIGSFLWSLLFAKKHFFWSELVLILNFFNILVLYFSHKTYAIKPLTNWVLIHWSTAAFPLSWLLYAIFWNGAVLFHVHKLVGRIVSNVLVWDFLLVPGFFLVTYEDWAVGLSSSALAFGLGLGQLLLKVFALQWIFAFVIAGLLLVWSVFILVRGSNHTEEHAPLLEAGV